MIVDAKTSHKGRTDPPGSRHKAFSMLRPPGYQWGVNLWHSTAIEAQSDDQILHDFGGYDVVVFDEMVQRGRDIGQVRERLEKIGLVVRTVCLVRRRSQFLKGKLVDLHIEPIEDLEDPEFDLAAEFLSHLFDYCQPPLDPEHVVVTGTFAEAATAAALRDRLDEAGITQLIWNRQATEDSWISAVTVDRPRFFDVAALELPDGIGVEWDGPCKIREYLTENNRFVSFAFITFPTMAGDVDSWRRVIERTRSRYQGPPPPGRGRERDETDDLDDESVARAYIDICTDLSISLLAQAASTGFFDTAGVAAVKGSNRSELAAFFGPRRGREVHEQIRDALERRQTSLGLTSHAVVPLVVDHDRTVVQAVDPQTGQEIVARLLSDTKKARTADSPRTGLSYRELLTAARPIEEFGVSAAVDGLLDGVRAKPFVRVSRLADGTISATRAFDGSEYGADDPYDAKDIRRAQAIAVSAFRHWLQRRGQPNETEIHVTKLFANLVHDWGKNFTHLAIKNHPFKHGMMPRLETKVPWRTEEPRYLLRELRKAHMLVSREDKRSERYAIKPGFDVDLLVKTAGLNGHERAQIKSLVRAYALIQQHCKVTRRKAPGSGPGTFSDPLVVLSSARSEKVAYECAVFEIGDWISIGRGLFRSLGGHGFQGEPDAGFASDIAKESVAFAQAVAFLFGKLEMYAAVPKLREQLVRLFEAEDLEAGEIILESVTPAIRWETDYSNTDSPMGLLRWAHSLMHPFTSFVRQALTQFGLETDRRTLPQRSKVLDDGTVIDKDAQYYAEKFAGVVADPAVASDVTRLGERIPAAKGNPAKEAAVLNDIAEVFERVIEILHQRIRTNDELAEEHSRRDDRQRDLISVARQFDASSQLIGPGTLVAVGDFYNFVSFVAQTATWTGATGASLAEGLHDSLNQVVTAVASRFAGVVARVSSDTCVLACDDPEVLLSATQHLNRAMRLEMAKLDRDIAYMRFGITVVEHDFFQPIVRALKLGDRHGFARGGVTLDQAAYDRLTPASQKQATPSPAGNETIYVIDNSTSDEAAA
jgi:hypothetical protein